MRMLRSLVTCMVLGLSLALLNAFVLLYLVAEIQSQHSSTPPVSADFDRPRIEYLALIRNAKTRRELWKGEYISEQDRTTSLPTVVDIVVTFCQTDFTGYLDEFDAFLPEEVQKINLVVMSKCGNELTIEEVIKAKIAGTHRKQFEYIIHALENKGGCDLGITHYANLFLAKETVKAAKEKVVFFLKDSAHTMENLHLRGVQGLKDSEWRDLEDMWKIVSKGRFICGAESKQSGFSPSAYHHPEKLKNFMLKAYKRHNSPGSLSNTATFTKGYQNLGDFVQNELIWSFPNEKAVEVCYTGTFAVPGLSFFTNKYLQEDAAHVEELLLNGPDMSVVEHFLERLWAAMLAKPLSDYELDIFMDMQSEAHDDHNDCKYCITRGIYSTNKISID